MITQPPIGGRERGEAILVGTKKGTRVFPGCLFLSYFFNELDDLDVLGLGSFGGLFDFKGHPLAFLQGSESVPLNGTEMDEEVFPVILLDEAITLFFVEPFYLSFCHSDNPPFSNASLE
jgi:hypothetical protein